MFFTSPKCWTHMKCFDWMESFRFRNIQLSRWESFALIFILILLLLIIISTVPAVPHWTLNSWNNLLKQGWREAHRASCERGVVSSAQTRRRSLACWWVAFLREKLSARLFWESNASPSNPLSLLSILSFLLCLLSLALQSTPLCSLFFLLYISTPGI